jgi:hypothetical protein
MIFQLMDSKLDCAGVYLPNKFVFDRIPSGLTKTWAWSHHLDGRDIEYAQLWVGGRSLDDVCPDHLTVRWEAANSLLKAHFKAFGTSKIDLGNVCFYDVVPQKHLQHYFDTKNEITKWVFENVEKPKNYSFLKETFGNLRELSKYSVNLNLFGLYNISKTDKKAEHLYKQFEGKPIHIDYDIFGTVTGRLTTKRGSFPILNLKKELKSQVTPQNDVFLELDFNAAEIRTLLSLQNIDQPQEDIHEWNIKNVFKKELSRDEAKTKIFAWLYNPESSKHHLGGQSMLPVVKPSTIYSNLLPQTTPLTGLTRFLVTLGHQDPKLWQLFMIALSSYHRSSQRRQKNDTSP